MKGDTKLSTSKLQTIPRIPTTSDVLPKGENRNLDFLPGNYGWPVIGNTFKLLNDPKAAQDELFQKYGKVIRVDALFQRSRVSGVVVGMGDDECQLKFVSNTADVKVGDLVLSSGLGGIFPKGLIIGKVSEVLKKKQGLFQEITLIPGSDLSRLEEVLVLLP
jgi:hypothetical protein